MPRRPQNRLRGHPHNRPRDIQPDLRLVTASGSSKPVRVRRFVVIRPVLRRPSVRSPPKRRPTRPRVLARPRPHHWAHLTLSAPFQVGHQPYPASSPRPHRWRPTLAWSTGSCRLSTYRHSLLGHPVPLRSWALLAVGLPAHRGVAGPQRGFHVPHERDTTGTGAPSTPRTTVLTRPECRPPVGVCRFTAASPWTPLQHPIGGASRNEASSRVHWRSPFRSSPSPVATGWNSSPWA